MELTTTNSKTDKMAASIHGKLEGLPASFSQRSIHRVPEYISKGKKKCYQPLLVSIGPVFFRDASLLAMKEHKLSFLRSFLKHRLNPHNLQHYIDFIREREISIRDCYEKDVSSISSNDFVEMVLVDAAFSIYFLAMGNQLRPLFLFDEALRPMYCEIRRDLFLEENQLPFFVLEDLFQEAFGGSVAGTSFLRMVSDLIAEGTMPLPGMATANSETVRKRLDEESSIEHLVDIMRIFCLPSTLRLPSDPKWSDLRFPPTISNLKASGVKFVASSTKSLLELTFSKGILEMPVIVVSDFSESFFRSVALFEQRHHYRESYFIDYVHFLDKLIDTAEDVRILVRAGVIENWLGSDQAVADVFNGITNLLPIEASDFHYADVCKGLLKFSATRCNRWKAILGRDYFSHPWSILSVVYAVIVFLLAVSQTIHSFTSRK